MLALVLGLVLVVPANASAAVALGLYTRAIYADSEQALEEVHDEIGIVPQIAMYYQNWDPGWETALINPKIVDPLVKQGVVPMITWEPATTLPGSFAEVGYSPTAIAQGTYDAFLRRAAREAVNFRHPLFVRLAAEMNGNWSSWGATPGNSPAAYVAMWRHVVSIFRAAGASNVRWVWSPNVFGTPSTVPFDAYYPGDGWVDVVGLDGYNWAAVHDSPWLSFDQVFQKSYDAITRLTSKPVMIAETASTELGGSKAAWIREIPHTLATQMPRIRALVWFDVEKETDWRLASSASSLSAFRGLVGSGLFSSSLTELFSSTASASRAADSRRASATTVAGRTPRSER